MDLENTPVKEIDFFSFKDSLDLKKSKKSNLIYGNPLVIKKRVTIAIPTYKRLLLLRDALESAVNQVDYDNYEILIVDNDPVLANGYETEKMIRSFNCDKIRYYRNDENIGGFENWNRCFELAAGDWVTLLHDDDYFFPYYLREMMKVIDKNPHIQGLTSFQNFWHDDGVKHIRENWAINQIVKEKQEIIKITLRDMFFSNRVSAANVMYKRDNILELGGFNPDFYPPADYVINSQYISRFNNVYLMKSFLSIYRILENDSIKKDVQKKIIKIDYLLRLAIAREIKMPFTASKIIAGNLAAKAIKKNSIESIADFEDFNQYNSFLYLINIPIAKILEIFLKYSLKLRSLQAKIKSFRTN